jgi:sterol desaturase/sphingolipid hydroxylase (fatty acid hydroxylase superfamily)
MFNWDRLPLLLEIPLFGIFFTFLENRFPHNKKLHIGFLKRPEFDQDIAWLLFDQLEAPILGHVFGTIFSYLFWSHLSSLFLIHKIHPRPLIAFIIIVAWGDFIFWVYHFCMHRFKFLWRFHELHHSSEHMDWLATFRGYWVDSSVSDALMGFIFFYVAVTPRFVFCWTYFTFASSLFLHCNVKFNLGIFSNWINCPDIHHWHHAKFQKYKGGQNFGIYTTFWDHIFGTYYIPGVNMPPDSYGLSGKVNYPKDFLRRFIRPFILNFGKEK